MEKWSPIVQGKGEEIEAECGGDDSTRIETLDPRNQSELKQNLL